MRLFRKQLPNINTAILKQLVLLSRSIREAYQMRELQALALLCRQASLRGNGRSLLKVRRARKWKPKVHRFASSKDHISGTFQSARVFKKGVSGNVEDGLVVLGMDAMSHTRRRDVENTEYLVLVIAAKTSLVSDN
jgi:hypothetical protein